MNTRPASVTALTAFAPPLPTRRGEALHYGRLYGSALALLIASAAKQHKGLLMVVTNDMTEALRLETELRFYLGNNSAYPILAFPDWETLPYDVFSPHQDIVSQRLETLYRLPNTRRGILLAPVTMLLQRLAPRSFLQGNTFILETGAKLELTDMRERLTAGGYRCVPQVMEHGEFAVRGSILDIFPSGVERPIRLDLLDDEIDSLRTFDPETQRTIETQKSVRMLPAREFPSTEQAIATFRQTYRRVFEGDPARSLIYRDVSTGIIPSGIEYYLPLYFDHTETLFDYLPANTLVLGLESIDDAAKTFATEVAHRYEQRRHDIERPILPPEHLFLNLEELKQRFDKLPNGVLRQMEWPDVESVSHLNFATAMPPDLRMGNRGETGIGVVKAFVENFEGRVLFAAETEGRREVLKDMLRDANIHPTQFASWEDFLASKSRHGMAIAPLEEGLLCIDPPIAVIAEPQLFGERVQQRRRRRAANRDNDAIVRNLTELHIGAPVVHEDHGVGRYQGLQKLAVGGIEAEFLTIEYAGGDKLYVPVASLHLVSRYTGSSPEGAPLHRLGTDQWEKARRKAAEQVRDVAAELLEIYARREASRGHALHLQRDEYNKFADAFQFEETPDQQTAIEAVLHDLERERPMDRVVCGDVGFGKTEVAMRAAFIAVNGGKQVAVLVPTTLLAQQHYQNFSDRFADWPVRVEVLSRFRSKKEQDQTLKGLKDGVIDIVIGTHKLLQDDIAYKNLGLVIVDEEHRFGVRQKEKFKTICANVHLLALTATPIPRTLNMALASLRDLSIIATPPAHRLAVKTFVSQWDKNLIKEACQREIKRGGQVYVLHNDVDTIEKTARELAALVPEAKVEFAHGQMRERDLEQVMLDFYHRRFNLLVCTTIIESGIDVPTANTIIINRADKLGLAQLHQLRGRVGRSHHRAYAYLIVPPKGAMTPDAVKRLEAIESLEDLGAGFMLATHDLEIRGAGELLGEGQSGQIQEVGFTLYTELLQRAVKALRSGRHPELDRPLDHGAEIELHIAALIPDSYLPDVHTRLTLYKRIASAADEGELRDLQVEMIDRFSLLPDPIKNLFEVTRLKLIANPLGVRKIEMSAKGGRLLFNAQPAVDPSKIIKLIQSQPKVYKLDGPDKLRYSGELPNAETRIKAVDAILSALSPPLRGKT